MADRIQIDPRVRHGAPVIAGTRVPVSRLVAAIAGGDRVDQVAADYGVTIEDVRAALKFASELIDQQQFRALPKSA